MRRGRVRPHLAVHGGSNDERCAGGEGDAGQRVVGESASEAGQRGGGGGCDEQQVGAIGQLDVARTQSGLLVEDIGGDGIFAQRLQGERSDEALRGAGHDDMDVVAAFDEQAREVGGFVSGDGAGDAEDDGFAGGHVRDQGR